MLVDVLQIEELPQVVSDLAQGRREWRDVVNSYPAFEQQETG
jgi:hypothetical protein